MLTFHGALGAAACEEAKQIKAELLIHHGAEYPTIGADDVPAFKILLDGAGVKYELIAHPGPVRSFTVSTADEIGIASIKQQGSRREILAGDERAAYGEVGQLMRSRQLKSDS